MSSKTHNVSAKQPLFPLQTAIANPRGQEVSRDSCVQEDPQRASHALGRDKIKTEKAAKESADRSLSRRQLSAAPLLQDFDQLLAGLVSRVQYLSIVLQDKELSEH